MLLGLRAGGAIIDQGSAGNRVGAIVDLNGRIRKISIRVLVAYTNLRYLAWSTGYRVLMAFAARCSVEHRTESEGGVFTPLKYLLIEGVRVSRRLRYSIAEALRAGVRGL